MCKTWASYHLSNCQLLFIVAAVSWLAQLAVQLAEEAGSKGSKDIY